MTYLAKWPDGTISILTADSKLDLFDGLDHEDNPLAAEIYELPERFLLKTSSNTAIDFELDTDFSDSYKLKRVKFPKNIHKQWADSIV